MKARVKETGEIVEVIAVGDYINEFGQIIGEYKDADGMPYNSYDLDFYIEEGITIPDYWTRLEHQYAGMAMQGILSNPEYLRSLMHTKHDDYRVHEVVPNVAVRLSHALVQELKEKEERK